MSRSKYSRPSVRIPTRSTPVPHYWSSRNSLPERSFPLRPLPLSIQLPSGTTEGFLPLVGGRNTSLAKLVRRGKGLLEFVGDLVRRQDRGALRLRLSDERVTRLTMSITVMEFGTKFHFADPDFDSRSHHGRRSLLYRSELSRGFRILLPGKVTDPIRCSAS